ncbi:unnamed protein product [Schistocephalus solidus]|uniref:Uncharacterized protein n=1 Tax=Schistocephalus solidus TaxID=70667 RepID=A0A183TG26_SCHSO|nr:unnamed protein product [Schistocephalus solidus]
MTTQYLNRAKQAALASSGAGHLAPLFGPAGDNCRPSKSGPYQSGAKTVGRQGCGCCASCQQQQQQQQQQTGPQCSGTLAFTSQLSGLPVPEHPSGAFPNFNYVMVSPQETGGCSQSCGGGGRPPYFQQQSSPGQQMPWQQSGPPQQPPPQFSFNQGPPTGTQWPPMDASSPTCQCGRCGSGSGGATGGMTMTNLF